MTTIGSMSAPALTPDKIDEIVRETVTRLNLDAETHRLIKFTNNAVVALPGPAVVLRIAGSEIVRSRVPGVISAAQWYERHDISAVRLWPGTDQPLQVGPYLVTVWDQIIETGAQPTPADLGAVLRAIHAVHQDEPADLPLWNVAGGMRRRITSSTGLPDETLAFLQSEADDIADSLTKLRDIPPLIPPGVVHGDAHLGNLMVSADGPVICDFDSTSIGPREWDLTPAAVGSIRFNYPDDVHAGLVDTYGLDVTTWEGFPILRRLREFQLVVSVLPVLDANPALRPQWQHRFETYRAHDEFAPWTPYADATS
jgi:phosphotransferase family enzyme